MQSFESAFGFDDMGNSCFYKSGFLFVGVLEIRGLLLFRVYMRAPDIWKCPYVDLGQLMSGFI